MVDEVITKQELIDAQKDAQSLEEFISGGDEQIVVTRLLKEYPTLANAIRQIYEKGGKFYPTLAAANADIANIRPDVYVITGDNGAYYKATSGATSLTKSPHDPLAQGKAYTDAVTNVNLYRSNREYTGFISAASIDKSLVKADYAPTEIRYKGVNLVGGFTVPYNGEFRSKLNVWVKVKSAALNAGTNMRLLVQAARQSGTFFVSTYAPIANGATGWVKLTETVMSEADRAVFKQINIQPQVTGGAELIVEDFYIGSGTPLDNFIRAYESKDVLMSRTYTRKSLLPHWTKYPKNANATINDNGDITIAPSSSYTITVPVKDVRQLHFCTYVDQLDSGDCKIILRGYRKELGTTQDFTGFPSAVNGSELSASITFDSVINKTSLIIYNNNPTSPLTLREFDLCYDKVAVNGTQKNGERFDEEMLKSEIITAVTSADINQNYSTFPNFELVPKSADGKRYATNLQVLSESVGVAGIETGKSYYISFPDLKVSLNGGTSKIVIYQVNSSGVSVGASATVNLTTGFVPLNTLLAIAETAAKINIRTDVSGGAVVELGKIVISDIAYSDVAVFQDYYREDATGTVLSDFQYPKLTGYSRIGEVVEYPITKDGSDPVLAVPNTSATGNGQGVEWRIDIPQNTAGTPFLTFQVKSNFTGANPCKVWIRYYKEGQANELGATLSPLLLNADGTWTLNLFWLPKTYNGQPVQYIRLALFNGPTATEPLYVKRFIQSEGIHNPFIRFINSTVADATAGGFVNFKRLTDALIGQPQGAFSVGKQLFRPLKSLQATTDDYELMNSAKNMPSVLRDKMYVDGGAYRIATIDSNDDFILHKSGTGNLYRLKPSELFGRFTKSGAVGGEQFATFNDVGLTPFTTTFSNSFLRIAADGTFIGASRSEAKYSVDGGVTWTVATGYQDTEGDFYNAWGFHTADNVVLTSGYRTAPDRQTGKVNYSSDYGKTYKVIFDVATASIISAEARPRTHIHSVAYDKYAKRVWMVMGDYYVPTENMTGKILYCDNPDATTPVWNVMSSGSDYYAEQHVSIYPLEDCILFGSDSVQSGIYRMARGAGDLRTDLAVFLHAQLAYYGCGGWQQSKETPMAIYMARASEYVAGDVYDKVFLTFDGVNYSTIVSDNPVYAGAGGKVDSFPFALRNHFVLDKRGDNRFASKNTWLVGTY